MDRFGDRRYASTELTLAELLILLGKDEDAAETMETTIEDRNKKTLFALSKATLADTPMDLQELEDNLKKKRALGFTFDEGSFAFSSVSLKAAKKQVRVLEMEAEQISSEDKEW